MMRRALALAMPLVFAAAAHAGAAADSSLAAARGLYRQARYDSCMAWLDRADSAAGAPMLETAYLRGRCLGHLKRYEAALSQLEQYDRITGDPGTAAAMKAAAVYFRDRIYETLAREAAAAEAAGHPPVNRCDSAVAVLNFLNAGASPGLDPLQKGLADMLITDCAQVAALRVVERTRMQKLLQELDLDAKGASGEDGRKRVARMLGAAKTVVGMFRGAADSSLQVRAAVADAAANRLAETGAVGGPLARIFAIEKEMAFAVIEMLGVKLTDEERLKIQTVRTESLLAFMAYCRGIDAHDRADYAAALDFFRQALMHDPAYADAAAMAEAMESALALANEFSQDAAQPQIAGPPVVYEGSGPAAAKEEPAAQRQPALARSMPGSGGLTGRMAAMANANFMPEFDVAGGPATGGATFDEGGPGNQRPDYADYRNSGFQNRQTVPVRILLPQQ